MKVLEVNNISKSFRSRKIPEDVSFNVNSGSIIAITGENGVGKSTLLNIITGWLKPDSGIIRMTGNFGYCPQETLLFPRLTVSENIEYFITAYGSEFFKSDKQQARPDELLREFDFYCTCCFRSSFFVSFTHHDSESDNGTQKAYSLLIQTR